MGRDIDVQGRGPTSRSSCLTLRIVAEIDLGIKFVGGTRANRAMGTIARTLARISISVDFARARASQSSRDRAAAAKTDDGRDNGG